MHRLLFPEHGGVRGVRPLLRGDGGPLLSLHVRCGAGRRVGRVLSLFPVAFRRLIVPARALPQGRDLQELEEVPGGVYGDPDICRIRPGEGATQAGPQR